MATAQNESTTFTFRHPELGPLTGLITPEKVVQFRAIPYATIPDRFKQSILLEDLSETGRDFTKFGYASPQTFGAPIFGGGPFSGDTLPPLSDEFKCLILQINVPLACLQDASPRRSILPVLIYIHGGGFVLGKIDQAHNTAPMVEQSLFDSQPIISGSIQYRLGALGYLFTPELENANLALNDQLNALLWIQKFVGGFGGDPKRVTLFGESAGSMSICYQMLKAPPPSGPLFNRVVLMSGVIGPMAAPTPLDAAGKLYDTVLNILQIEERGMTSLAKLRELDVQKIVEATSKLSEQGVMLVPVRDERWFGEGASSFTWERFPELMAKCDWVDEIVLGVTGFEGLTFASTVAGLTPTSFRAGIEAQLGQQSTDAIMKAYNVTPDMDQNLFVTAGTRWIGDVVFDAPVHALAKYLTTHTNKKVFRYVFHVRNPFPGSPLYQQSHHWVDVYFVFRTFLFRYPTENLKRISTRHAQLWVDFANRKAPWREYKYIGDGSEIVMVADERDGWVERTLAKEEEITELSNRRVEALWESWKGQSGKWFLPMKIEPLLEKKLT